MSDYFTEMYITYYERVYSTCYMILRNHELAEDITQETFATAFEKLRTLKDPAKFSAWVIAIANNKALSLYRLNNKVVPLDEEAAIDYFEQINGNQNDLSDVLIEEKKISDIKEAINQLKPELKKIIFLKYYLELPEKEISERIKKPVGTVKSSLHRAKRFLAKLISFRLEEYSHINQGCD